MALRRATAALAGFAACGLPGAGDAATPCRHGPVSVEMRVIDPEPPVSTGERAADLQRLMAAIHGGGIRHLGLTSSRVEWQGEIAASGTVGPNGVCMVVSGVTMTLTQAEHLIRIAREIPPGSCLYAEVEAHERRHVAVNRETLRAAAEQARQVAFTWARGAEGRGPTPQRAVEALRQDLQRVIEPVLERMRTEQARGHAAIDTPTESRRIAAACPEDHAGLAARLREP